MRRSPAMDRRVVADGSEAACVSMVSVSGASRLGKVAASRLGTTTGVVLSTGVPLEDAWPQHNTWPESRMAQEW